MRQGSGKPFHDYVDMENGTVDRVIFTDQEVYDLEMERIFARAWNFMCHESQIPKKGDFFLNYIGEESVIATRDKGGNLQVFLNTCRHRGNAVCRAESGNARSFLCTYHGWTYGLDGKLIGVPGYKDYYHEELDRGKWGLISAGKVQSYKGFVFATMDPEAPDLHDYLGEVGRMGLDTIAERGDEMVIVEGVQKNRISCNWKLAVDNLYDWYHGQISHASAFMSGYAGGRMKDSDGTARLPFDPLAQRVLLGEFGHGIGGPRINDSYREKLAMADPVTEPAFDERWRDRPAAKAALGEVGKDVRGHPNVFPNLWVSAGGGPQLCLRLPKGPNVTEIWWFTFLDKNLTEEEHEHRMARANHTFGPAGMLEQDDGENWEQSTRQTRGVVARRYPLNFAMGLGRGVLQTSKGEPSYIDTVINEHAQLWTYCAWADWMDADSWPDLMQRRTALPKII